MPKINSHQPSVQKYWQDYQKNYMEQLGDLSWKVRLLHAVEMICAILPVMYGTYFYAANASRVNRKFRGGRKNRNI
jgi:hypothetical protein